MYIKIPTKPYLKRYLHSKHPMPFSLRMNSNFGVFLYHLLRDRREDAKYEPYVKQYNVKYTVRVSKYHMFDRGATNLSSYTIIRFNTFVEEKFKAELYAYLEQSEHIFEQTKHLFTIRNSPFTIKAAILQFLAKYNIDQGELSYDTVKKSYYRYRQKKLKKSPCSLSPKLNPAAPPVRMARTA